MTILWRAETCRDCEFQVQNKCKRFPPQFSGSVLANVFQYPQVNYKEGAMKACAEYKKAAWAG